MCSRQVLMYSAMFLSVLDVVWLLGGSPCQCLTWLVLVVLELVGVLWGLAGASPGWGSPPLWFGLGFYGDRHLIEAKFLDSVSA